MFGGGSESNTYTQVSAEVEAYDPLIRQYAKQYGIPEYVELIKAVMIVWILRIETALCCLHGVKSPTAAFLHHHGG